MIFKKKIFLNDQESKLNQSFFIGNTITWTIILSFSFGFIYACFTRIDEVVISRGEIQSIGAGRKIKMPFNGFIKKVNINEGDLVKKNDKLIFLENDLFLIKKEKLIFSIKELRKILNREKKSLKVLEELFKDGAVNFLSLEEQKNKVAEIETKIFGFSSDVKELKYLIEQTILRSPIKGRIFNLLISNEGNFAKEGETLLTIVPEGPLEAKVFIDNKDIGFLKPGMEAEIRIDAYPFTQFGHLDGNLRLIGEDSIKVENSNLKFRFPGYVKLSNPYIEKNNKRYPLKSGQTVTVNFKTRDKPLITLVTDVIANAWDALRGIKTEAIN